MSDHRFYHYTCEHGYAAMGQRARLLTAMVQLGNPPGLKNLIGPQWVWATDLETPNRDALGLTSAMTPCDRIEYRYRVVNIGALTAWVQIAREFYSSRQRAQLESTYGAMPRHWYVGTNDTVEVEYAPR